MSQIYYFAPRPATFRLLLGICIFPLARRILQALGLVGAAGTSNRRGSPFSPLLTASQQGARRPCMRRAADARSGSGAQSPRLPAVPGATPRTGPHSSAVGLSAAT